MPITQKVVMTEVYLFKNVVKWRVKVNNIFDTKYKLAKKILITFNTQICYTLYSTTAFLFNTSNTLIQIRINLMFSE